MKAHAVTGPWSGNPCCTDDSYVSGRGGIAAPRKNGGFVIWKVHAVTGPSFPFCVDDGMRRVGRGVEATGRNMEGARCYRAATGNPVSHRRRLCVG